MIVSINSDRNTMNIVVGNFYVVGHKDADKKHGFIIKNSDGYSSYANESIENRNLLKQLDKLKIERPLVCGIYEDWEGAVDLGLTKVTEAVARQYEALDYILASNQDTGTALYMLSRIERSYSSFVEKRYNEGEKSAYEYIESYRKRGETEPRMVTYHKRLIDRIKSNIPPCLGFFQDPNINKYISQLTQSQSYFKKPELTINEVTFNKILIEYLKTNKPDIGFEKKIIKTGTYYANSLDQMESNA